MEYDAEKNDLFELFISHASATAAGLSDLDGVIGKYVIADLKFPRYCCSYFSLIIIHWIYHGYKMQFIHANIYFCLFTFSLLGSKCNSS